MKLINQVMLISILIFSLSIINASEDGILLSMEKGPETSSVTLNWSGKEPTFEVYRSTDPQTVIKSTHKVGETQEFQWVDTPPGSELLFYKVGSRPPVLDDLLPTATEVAGFMETERAVNNIIFYGSQVINSAQFLYLASKSILALTSADPFPPADPPAGLLPPANPYPKIQLEESFYNNPFSKEEYLAFFRQIDNEFEAKGSYPSKITVEGTQAEVRFSDMIYYAAGVLRSKEILGYLPDFWNRYIISVRALVPWGIPLGNEEYTSALESHCGTPFFINHCRRYYGSSAHEYSMLKLAESIYGNSHNPYKAGEKIYDWVKDQWLVVVGYTSGKVQFASDRSGWESAHHYYHTSGVPGKIISHLMRASGIPSSISGAAYFTNEGWVNIDPHKPYGSDPLENPFYYDDVPPRTHNMPYPSLEHDFIPRINEISDQEPVPPQAGETRSVYINPSDVLDYGASYILDNIGNFDTLILTVKTLKGYLYYGSTGWPEREQGDALQPLLVEAHSRGIKVYAALSTLGDRITAGENPDWRQKLNETNGYPNVHISPCVQAYQDRLTSLIENLVLNYDVDGVVLDYLYYANIFGNEDTEGHPDCPMGTDWMPGVITDYANDLASTARSIDPSVPIVIVSYPAVHENRYYGLGHTEMGHQDMQALSQIADDIMLVILGTYWLPVDPPYWQTMIADYQTITGSNPWVTFLLVDEWEYAPRFYRGLVHYGRESGIAGFNLHTPLSTLGELSPALTRAEWEAVNAINLKK
jgi:hypothetical protein